MDSARHAGRAGVGLMRPGKYPANGAPNTGLGFAYLRVELGPGPNSNPGTKFANNLAPAKKASTS